MTVMTRDTARVASETAGRETQTEDADVPEDATSAASSNGQETKSPPGLETTTGQTGGVNAPMAAALTAKETGTKSGAGSEDGAQTGTADTVHRAA